MVLCKGLRGGIAGKDAAESGYETAPKTLRHADGRPRHRRPSDERQ